MSMRVFMGVNGGLCVSIEVYEGLWESMDKHEYTKVYGCQREFMGVYGSLFINMSIRDFMDVYGSLCISMESMSLWGEYGGLLWINVNIRVFINIYGSLCMSIGVYEVYGEFLEVHGRI